MAWAANSAGQPGVAGGGFAEFQRALAAWNAEPTTPIHYAYVGQTDATGGLGVFDGVNTILFDEPVADPFDCDKGGVLAVGGPWYDTRQRAAWGGESFIPVTGADIVTNAGIGCFLARSANPSKAAEEIFEYDELGHTLGLSHSCGDAGSGACVPNGAAGDSLCGPISTTTAAAPASPTTTGGRSRRSTAPASAWPEPRRRPPSISSPSRGQGSPPASSGKTASPTRRVSASIDPPATGSSSASRSPPAGATVYNVDSGLRPGHPL